MNSSMYAELHCHSNYSFQEGASSVEDLLVRARDLGYPALALTDHDNLCGAMHFAQVAKTLDIQAITGAELTIKDSPNGPDGKDGSHLTSHLTFLAENQEGYSQLSNLISYSYVASDRRNPALDLKYLPDHIDGLILLTGCRAGRVPSLLDEAATPRPRPNCGSTWNGSAGTTCSWSYSRTWCRETPSASGGSST